MNDKTYVSVWVDEDIAKEIKALESNSNQRKIVEEVAKGLSLNIESELTQLDDDLARYKAACIVFKTKLIDVYHEQQDEIEKVIDNIWDIMPKVKDETSKMITQIQQELLPLRQELTETKSAIANIKAEVDSIEFWKAGQMIELVDKINNMDEKSKDLLKFMMDNYKEV